MINVIYEDNHLLVVEKPINIPVQADSSNDIDLLNLNGLDKENYIYPGQEIIVPKSNIKLVVTNKNDSINTTCKRLNIDSNTLLEQNSNILLSPDQILVYRK